MAVSSLLERVASALFGGREASVGDQVEPELLADAIELVVDAVEPRVRYHGGYRHKMESCVCRSIAFLREIARSSHLEPVPLTRAAWGTDPRVNAFFATPDDVPECLGRNQELRAFFEDAANLQIPEAYALLGMKMQERTVLAPQLEGGALKQEVAQTTVSFSNHRLVAPAATLAASRLEVGRRIIRLLAHIALSRIVALDAKATELEQRKASLAARLRLLELGRDGMHGIVEDPAAHAQKIEALQRELKETVGSYVEAKTSLASLDVYIEHIDDVFSHPEQHIALTRTPLRLNRMGYKVDEASTEPINEVVLTQLSIGENLHAAIAIAHCPRSELPPKVDLLAKAERYL